MARKRDESLAEAVSAELKSNFNLDKFKDKKGLTGNVKFKTQKWIPFSQAVKNALSIPGIPMGHITLARGGSDTGKTTLLIETAITAQEMGILPVFIITEQKWDFRHAKQMGLQLEEIPDTETGEIVDHKGFFIYVDRSSLSSIEDVAGFIADILDEQKRGNLPYDLLFLWDSSGSIPCKMSIDQNNNNPMWNAGAMATQFGNFINQKFPLSRKENYIYTNTFFVINKTGVQPALTFGSQPRMTNKGGNAMYWDSTVVVTFGNVTNSGTSKISVQHKGKKVEFAKQMLDNGTPVNNDISFNAKTNQINPESVSYLDTIGQIMSYDPTMNVQINGNDIMTPAEHSNNNTGGQIPLSEAEIKIKLESIKTYLVDKFNVQADRIVTGVNDKIQSKIQQLKQSKVGQMVSRIATEIIKL